MRHNTLLVLIPTHSHQYKHTCAHTHISICTLAQIPTLTQSRTHRQIHARAHAGRKREIVGCVACKHGNMILYFTGRSDDAILPATSLRQKAD